MSEYVHLRYGQCPYCGEMCQPDFSLDDDNEEWASCDDCEITWSLWHDDPKDKRDGTEPSRTYRVTDIRPY